MSAVDDHLETLHVTLIGFGAVNRAFARLVAREAPALASEHRLRIVYHAIVARHGCWESAVGAPLSAEAVGKLADEVSRGAARLDGATGAPPNGATATPKPSSAAICAIIDRMPLGLACLVEAIDVDYEAGEPATTYLRAALSRGCHAVSANKGPVVFHRADLLATAERAGVRYLHESAVMDGVPIFSTWRAGFLPGGARLRKFRGALNSTTSVVLSGMERGQSMEGVRPRETRTRTCTCTCAQTERTACETPSLRGLPASSGSSVRGRGAWQACGARGRVGRAADDVCCAPAAYALATVCTGHHPVCRSILSVARSLGCSLAGQPRCAPPRTRALPRPIRLATFQGWMRRSRWWRSPRPSNSAALDRRLAGRLRLAARLRLAGRRRRGQPPKASGSLCVSQRSP